MSSAWLPGVCCQFLQSPRTSLDSLLPSAGSGYKSSAPITLFSSYKFRKFKRLVLTAACLPVSPGLRLARVKIARSVTKSICERGTTTRTGDRVAFLISDAFISGSEEIRTLLSDTGEVEGTIMNFSDSGTASRVFAVVEVVRKQAVVIPVERLRLLESSGSSEEDKN